MNDVRKALDEDYFRSELLKLGFYKTQDGRQLYELDLDELQQFYEDERLKVKESV